jgi:hypothetical protein
LEYALKYYRMSYVEQVKWILNNPQKAKKFPQWLRSEYYDRAIKVNAAYSQDGPEGIDVMGQDWDNLLILDAARLDMLSSVSPLSPMPVVSKGSESWEFMSKNFVGRMLHDTVYISANPHTYWLENDVFHDVYNPLSTHWDGDTGTVHPEDMVSIAGKAQKEHPEKRLIVHFMQPHFPFLGESGEELDLRMTQREGWFTPPDGEEKRRGPSGTNPWYDAIVMNNTSPQRIIEAYKENHEIAWAATDKLLDELSGLSVVTADHANLIGERLGPLPMPGYGHPRGFHHPDLVTVPWAEVNRSGSRREITAEAPVDQERATDDEVNDRLEALGYA